MKELSEERKGFLDRFTAAVAKEREIAKGEQLKSKLEELRQEFDEIVERAYQKAVGEKVESLQEEIRSGQCTPERLEEIDDLMHNPEKLGVEREKCEFLPEDRERALEIAGLLKDTDKLLEPYADFAKEMKGFAERNANKANG